MALNTSQPSAAFDERQADWVPLMLAPFRWTGRGYISSMADWPDAVRDEIENGWAYSKLKQSVRFKRINDSQHFVEGIEGDGLSVIAMGITVDLIPGWVFVQPTCREDNLAVAEDDDGEVAGNGGPINTEQVDWVPFGGYADRILEDLNWDTLYESPEWSLAARCHRECLKNIFFCWRFHFGEALRSGAAQILARKNSVLAPFERITLNQWEYFSVMPPRLGYHDFWHGGSQDPILSTAVGPGDVTLYEIYVAPAVGDSLNFQKDDATPEQKCRSWIKNLLCAHPERPPKPIPQLAGDAITRFPGLTKRKFLHCYGLAQLETGNSNWGRTRRRPKSAH
jgi:hypothetical protein